MSVFVTINTLQRTREWVSLSPCALQRTRGWVSLLPCACAPENSGVSVFVAMCIVQRIQGCLWWHVHSPENWGVGVFVTGFAWSLKVLKVWGKWEKLFKALKVCESLWICGFQSAREKLSAYHKVCFPRPNSSLKNSLWILKGLFVWGVVLRSFIAHFILYMKQILRQHRRVVKSRFFFFSSFFVLVDGIKHQLTYFFFFKADEGLQYHM